MPSSDPKSENQEVESGSKARKHDTGSAGMDSLLDGSNSSSVLHSESTSVETPQIPSYTLSPEGTGLPAPYVRSNDDILPCLSVVVPVYNEAATVVDVIRSVLIQKPVQQLIVVDDASDDNTWSLLLPLAHEDARISLLRHLKNRGKGAALRTGFAAATAPIVIVQDADKEYRLARILLAA